MNLYLPTTLDIAATSHAIRWEYRDILTIISAAEDPELTPQERTFVALSIFYEDFEQIPPEHLQEACEKMSAFIEGGATPKKSAKLMDWEQDIPWIIAPINRIVGHDIRGPAPMHWWTFLSAYYEIGDCLFAQIVRIRDMRAKGKKLDKADREWARQNEDLIQIRTHYTEAEEDILSAWATKEVKSNGE